MANRDVDLVIRARNEASRAVEAITTSLEALVGKTEAVQSSGKKTDTVLQALKNRFNELGREAAGAQNLDKITGALERASNSVKKLTDNVGKQESELADLRSRTQALASVEEQLKNQATASAAAIDTQRAAVKNLKTEASAAASEISLIARQLKAIDAKAPSSTQARSSIAALSTDRQGRFGNIRNDLPGSTARDAARTLLSGELETQRNRQAGIVASLKAQEQALEAQQSELLKVNGSLRANGNEQRSLSTQIDSVTSAIEREVAGLNKAKAALTEIESVSERANASFGRTVVASRLAAEQAQIKARIDTLSTRQPATVAPTEIPAANRAKLEAYRAYTEATAEVTRLARAMREAEAPTEEMGAALGRAQAQARLAKQEYRELAEATQRLKTGAGGSFRAFSERVSAPRAIEINSAPSLPPIAPQQTRANSEALNEAAGSANAFRSALQGVYGDTRQSLSLMQRLRGEVLSLAASYVGLQAAIRAVGYVIEVFRGLETTQNRLSSVFNQNAARTNQEIDYLRRQANRLGVEFGTLSNEYGKFAIAAQSANVSIKDTRTIFMGVTEAGRVMGLTNDQLKGIFNALTQMMSKGKIQAEELRGQLGDRLSGAFSIFASAIGVTTAELDRMMKQGEVIASSDTMLAFAAEMTKRFGPQLEQALKSTSSEIGRFQNNLQSAAMQAANGGLIEGFTTLLRTLNQYLTSDEGRDFFLSLGAGARTFFEAVSALIPYLNTLKTIFGVIVAYKFATMILGASVALKTYAVDTVTAVRSTEGLSGAQARLAGFTAALNQQMLRMEVALTMTAAAEGRAAIGANVLAASFGALRTVTVGALTVVRGLFAALGGFAGIALTGLTIAAASWFTAVDDTTSSIEKHKAIIDKVVVAYDSAKDKAGDWANKIKDLNRAQVAVEAGVAEKTARDAMAMVKAPSSVRMTGRDEAVVVPQNQQLSNLVESFRQGKVSIEEFKKQIISIQDADPKLTDTVIAQIIKFAEKASDAKKTAEMMRAILAQMAGTATDAQKQLLSLNEAVEDNGFKPATKDAEGFLKAINELKSGIPQLATEMKRLKEEKDALEGLRAAVTAAGGDENAIKEAYGVYDQRRKSILDEETKSYIKQYGGDKIPLSMVNEIYGGEGFRSQAYKDQGGVPTIGFGSTRVDGNAVQMGDVISKADAVRQMVNDLNKFVAMIDSATGNAKLSENQRNALTSYVYNVGNTDGSAATRAIFEAIRRGAPDTEVAQLLGEGGIATINGAPSAALRARRRREAAMYLRPDDRAAGQDSGATSYDRDKARLDSERDVAESVRKRVEENNRTAGNLGSIRGAADQTAAKREIAIQNALLEAQNEALSKGTQLTAKQTEDIKASTAARWDQEHITDRATEAEEKVNALYKLRQQLLEELKVANEQGDATQLAATRNSIDEVNKKLQESIPLAIKYWQAIGGTEADTAVAKLRLMNAQTERNKTQIVTAQQVNEKFASGAVNAFDNIANGIGRAIAGTGSWKDAIQGVGIAFLQFAADFMREIANMILKQLVLNALQSSMGKGGGGGFGGLLSSAINAAVAHTGGVVGSQSVGSNSNRMVNPAWFTNARRFHNGGLPGLAPNEVPTILKKNEEVLTENDPRNVLNGGKSGGNGGAPQSLKVVAVFDPNEIPAAMQTSAGEQATMATLKKNRESIKQLLGGK